MLAKPGQYLIFIMFKVCEMWDRLRPNMQYHRIRTYYTTVTLVCSMSMWESSEDTVWTQSSTIFHALWPGCLQMRQTLMILTFLNQTLLLSISFSLVVWRHQLTYGIVWCGTFACICMEKYSQPSCVNLHALILHPALQTKPTFIFIGSRMIILLALKMNHRSSRSVFCPRWDFRRRILNETD